MHAKAVPPTWAVLGLLALELAARAFCDPVGNMGDPQYPVAYGKPAVADITAAMVRVLGHVEASGVPVMVDGATKEEITDLSTPNVHAMARLGGYPMGVFNSGALLAGQVTGDRRFTDYAALRMQFIADHLAYFRAQEAAGGVSTNFLVPVSLDTCGAWGAAIVRARLSGIGPDVKPLIDRWADYITTKQFRLPDGTLARARPQPQSLWADDMYMSVSFLAQLGKMTGDARYTNDAVRQVLQISARLFVWNRGLFTHGWSSGNADYNPEFHWGRANGWCDLAMCDLLDVLPAGHPARADILRIFRAHMTALASLQSGDGLWRQLLDRPDSFEETSCTAMFSYSMAHAINRGWISASAFGAAAVNGWNAVAGKVGPDGAVDGVCVGTNLASDAMYYCHRPAHDDVHGYGPVLLAGSEMIRLVQNDKIEIRMNGSGGCMIVADRK